MPRDGFVAVVVRGALIAAAIALLLLFAPGADHTFIYQGF